MKINFTNNHTTFGRTIYFMDTHVHDKPDAGLGKKVNPDDLLLLSKTPIKSDGDEFVLKKMLPSALDSIFYKEVNGVRIPWADELQGNREILKAYKDTPVKDFLAVCQPKSTKGDTSTIEKVLNEGKEKFVGLKFHPKEMQLAADSPLYDSYMELAKKKKLPCLFHSDRTFETVYNGLDGKKYPAPRCEYSRPEQIYALAKRHKDVPIIMGHMGGIEEKDAKAAINVLVDSIEKGSAKLYADISWVDCNTSEKPSLISAIERLRKTSKGDKTDRLLFGTDAPLGRLGGIGENGLSPKESYDKIVVDVHTAIKKHFGGDADDIIDKIFHDNADELFFKKKWAEGLAEGLEEVTSTTVNTETSQTVKNLSKGQIGAICAAGLLVVGAVFLLCKKFKTQQPINPATINNMNANSQAYVPAYIPTLNNFMQKVNPNN